MKRCIIVFLLMLTLVVSIDARTFVLVTGVSNYDNETVNLSQTTKDAKRFKKVMETQTKDITLLTSKNVTRANVLEKLRAICNRAQKNDRIIFFYSGHGMPGGICVFDRAISYDDLVAELSKSAAKEKICFIDACYAGSLAKSASEDMWQKSIKDNGQIFFVSCRPDEVSAESQFVGAGYFTQALLKGMRGKADTNGDKKVTVIELFKYIHNDVLKRSSNKQHPQLVSSKDMYDVVVTKW